MEYEKTKYKVSKGLFESENNRKGLGNVPQYIRWKWNPFEPRLRWYRRSEDKLLAVPRPVGHSSWNRFFLSYFGLLLWSRVMNASSMIRYCAWHSNDKKRAETGLELTTMISHTWPSHANNEISSNLVRPEYSFEHLNHFEILHKARP